MSLRKLTRERLTIIAVFTSMTAAQILPARTQDSVTQSEKRTQDTTAVFNLGEIVVTGKHAEPAFDKIDASAMDKANKTDVAKALNTLPGLNLVNVGPRNEANIYIRGFNSLQATMFLDGVPVYVPYDGNIDLARFTTFDISEISVQKGAVSPLFGANTMGGVINIVTRKPSSLLDLSVRTGMKSGEGYMGGANIGTLSGKFYAIGSIFYTSQNNYQLSDDFTPSKFQPKGDRGNSNQRDWKGSVKLGYVDSTIGEFSISASSQNGVKGTPVYAGTDSATLATSKFWKWPYYDKTNIYAISKINLGKVGYLKVPLYYDRFRNSLFAYDDATYTTFKKRSSFKSWYDDFTAGGSLEFVTGLIPNDSLKVAAQYKDDNHKESNSSNDTAKALEKEAFVEKPDIRFRDYTMGLAMENSLKLFDRLTLTPGASFSLRNAVTAQNLTEPKPYNYSVTNFPLAKDTGWSLQLATYFNIDKANVLNASVSRRTRFPSIKDRYSYRLGTAVPNPDLKPENAVEGELGYTGEPINNLYVQLTGWGADLNDVIQMVSKVGPNGESQFQNSGKARFYGYEAGVRYTLFRNMPALDHLELSFNHSYTKRRNISDPMLLFTDVPDFKDVITTEYAPVKWVALSWSNEWDSRRFSSSDGKRVAPAFTVENVRAILSWNNISLNAGIDNIFDVDYCLLEGYPEPGRNYYINIGYDFKRQGGTK